MALADDIAGAALEDRPRAIEMLGAFSRLVEAAGVNLQNASEPAGATGGMSAAASLPAVSLS